MKVRCLGETNVQQRSHIFHLRGFNQELQRFDFLKPVSDKKHTDFNKYCLLWILWIEIIFKSVNFIPKIILETYISLQSILYTFW